MNAARSPLAGAGSPRDRQGWRDELVASACCIVIAAGLGPLHSHIDPANTVMVFLLGVALIAYRLGRRPAVVAAFASVALFDFFFVPPRFSFAVQDLQYLIVFAVMLAVGLIVIDLTQRLQARSAEAESRERQSAALYGLARCLAGAADIREVETALDEFVADGLGAEAQLIICDKGRLTIADDEAMPAPERHQILATLADGRAHRCGGAAGGKGLRLLLPIVGTTGARGVLVVDLPVGGGEVLGSAQTMLEAVAALLATAIERLHFVDISQRARLETEAERLRGSILSALSHDLRTPLTALCGLADSFAQHPSAGRSVEIATAIRDQAFRLNGMVGKLLDLARLKSGPVRLQCEWQPLDEVVGSSLQLLGSALASHHIELAIDDTLPLLEFDAVLIERVLGNLLENAARWTPAGGTIRIAGRWLEVDARAWVEISVEDGGPGFAPGQAEAAFGDPARDARDRVAAGPGLGLAICRVIVEAHGGRIGACPRERGACVCFTLPCGTPPTIGEDGE